MMSKVTGYMMICVMREVKASGNILDKIIAASAKLSVGMEPDNKFMAHILEVAEIGKTELKAIRKADDDRMIDIEKNMMTVFTLRYQT